MTVIEPPAFGIARGNPTVEVLIERLLAIAADQDQSPREFLLRFAAVVGATPNCLTPCHRRRWPRRSRRWPGGGHGRRRPRSRRCVRHLFPKLVFSGAHSAPFDAVCDVLVERLAAERSVIGGAGHGVQRTAEPFNHRLRAFIDAV